MFKKLKILLVLLSLMVATPFAYAPPPPPPDDNGGSQNNGGPAPLGEGMGILVLLAGSYFVGKYYFEKRKLAEE